MKRLICFFIVFSLLLAFSPGAFAAFDANQYPAVIVSAVALRASTANGANFENTGYIGMGQAVLVAGAQGSGITLDVKLQHSADGSTSWTDITGATFTQVGNAAACQGIPVDLSAAKHYIRAVFTVAGGSATGYTSVIMLAKPKYTP